MAARQQRGFTFEAVVAATVPGFVATNPGDTFDGHIGDVPVSVKSRIATGDLCLGDYARQSRIDRDFIMIVGTVEAGGGWTVDAWAIGAAAWRAAFAYTGAAAMAEELKLITNLKADDARWTAFMARHQAAFVAEREAAAAAATALPGLPAVQLAGKRDHKTQKRIQARISARGYRDFRRLYLPAEGVPVAAIAAEAVVAVARDNLGITTTVGLDRYFTRPAGVAATLELLRSTLGAAGLRECGAVLEPAAGSGAFIPALRRLAAEDLAPGARVCAFDIEPADGADPEIETADFLSEEGVDTVAARVAGRKTLVVGNPPYGINSKMAIAFINRCATIPEADTIAFVLPRAFEKASVQKRVAGFTLAASRRLTDAESTFDDHEATAAAAMATVMPSRLVPSCVQIWRRGQAPPAPPPPEPNRSLWDFVAAAAVVERGAEFDFQVVRAGGSAGRAYGMLARTAARANYFVRLEGAARGRAAAVTARLNARRAELAADYEATTAVRSLAKPPLVRLLNEIVAAVAAAAATATAAATVAAAAAALPSMSDDDVNEALALAGW